MIAILVRAVLAMGAAALVVAGCARQTGAQATAGALESFMKKQAEGARPGESPAEIAAGRAVEGAIAQMSAPEQMAQMRMIVASTSSQAASSFGNTAVRALVEDLGRDGDGVLGATVSATARKVAAAATDGMLDRVAPDCAPGDSPCVSRRFGDLGRDAGAGFMRGVKDSIGWLALVLAFVVGVFSALLVAHVVSVMRTGRAIRNLPAGPAPRGAVVTT